MLLNLPYVQRKLGDEVAAVLTNIIGTKVKVGSINVGLLNRLIINDIEAVDQNGKPMLKVGRVSAKVDVWSTIQGQISIPSAQLFSASANIYKENKDSALNIQYVIDAFSSKEKKESKPINLRINTLLVRHTNVKYDVLDEKMKEGRFDVNHIDARNLGFNLSLKALTDDSLNVSLKRFSVNEYNSGLCVKELSLKCEANHKKANITEVAVNTSSSSLSIPLLAVEYSSYKKNKSFRLTKDLNIDGMVCLSDFRCFVPVFEKLTDTYSFSTKISGGSDKLDVKSLTLYTEDKDLNLDLACSYFKLPGNDFNIDGEIRTLHASSDVISELLSDFSVDEKVSAKIKALGDVDMHSKAHYNKSFIKADGEIGTDAGGFGYKASYYLDKKNLVCDIQTDATSDINLGSILGQEKLGALSAKVNADVTFVKGQKIPDCKLSVEAPKFVYNDYEYNNILINASAKHDKADVVLNVKDDNANLTSHVICALSGKTNDIDLDLNLQNFNPHAMKLTDSFSQESFSLNAKAKLKGSQIDDMNGFVDVNDVVVNTSDTIYTLDDMYLKVVHDKDNYTNISLTSDFMDARIKGHGKISNIVNDFKAVISSNLSQIIDYKGTRSNSVYDYDVTFYDSPILHHFIKNEYSVDEPINIIGSLDVAKDVLNVDVDAPLFTYGNNTYRDISLLCCNNSGQLSVKGSGLTHNEGSAVKVNLNSTVRNSVIDSDIKLKMKNQNDIDMDLKSSVCFADSLGKTKTTVFIREADVTINDTLWNVSPANISIYEKDIACNNLKISSGNKYIMVEGKASPNPADSLVAKLKDIDIEYVLNVVNFTAVNFSGIATGEATLYNLLGKPDFKADLNVKDFALEGNVMGNAAIHGNWDDSHNGIALNANIVNMYKCQDALTKKYNDRFGVTKVDGWVSPADNDIYLHIDAQDTHANVLEGYIGMIFKDIDGYLRGTLDIVGPMNKIDLIGDITGQMEMTLKATNVPYMISGDTIRIRRGSIALENVKMYDAYNNVGIINGAVTHTNLRNFGYAFDVDARSMLVYDEKQFNADKFMATAYASGNLHVDGSDGHPLNIIGDITTTRGSVFAYDNVSPDALASSSFIEFRDITNKERVNKTSLILEDEEKKSHDPNDLSVYIVKKEKKKSDYEGDIYMDFHVNMNPNCEVKLRMDRQDDAYISAFGNAILQAKWHNKGAFSLFGTYNIERGRYRLYMHDLVYRDLTLQPGSAVSFNGNPFDAGLHIICNHEIHNVPLSDLTSTNAYNKNNKVKVVCELDISGTISAMDFKFDLSLPNSNDETRQLVKSMINSEEEMNTQMIYLLAVNRFYPNDFARANGEDKSGQAVNSFVSSTLSGQINQILSNIIGTNSNWNFGTGISTGEKGWKDMDVEGVLSGRLFNDRLLINGNFGYRDNALTNTGSFIGDFELKWRLWENRNAYLKAYNMTNDRYFTKGTLNTQGLGISFQQEFESFKSLLRKKNKEKEEDTTTNDEK